MERTLTKSIRKIMHLNLATQKEAIFMLKLKEEKERWLSNSKRIMVQEGLPPNQSCGLMQRIGATNNRPKKQIGETKGIHTLTSFFQTSNFLSSSLFFSISLPFQLFHPWVNRGILKSFISSSLAIFFSLPASPALLATSPTLSSLSYGIVLKYLTKHLTIYIPV